MAQTIISFLIVAYCSIKTVSYGVFTLKENKLGGIVLFLVTALIIFFWWKFL